MIGGRMRFVGLLASKGTGIKEIDPFFISVKGFNESEPAFPLDPTS